MSDKQTLVIEAWDIDKPIDSERNNKVHDEASLKRLARSLESVGQIQPLIVDREGVIIAGHGRRAAARLLGWKHVKVIQLPVDETTARKMRLADNLSSNQNYDVRAISEEVVELNGILDETMEDITASLGLNDKMIDMLAPHLTGALDLNEDAFTEDLTREVDDFSAESDRMNLEIEETELPIHEAFGFKKAKPSQLRLFRMLVAKASEETGIEDPAAALAAWIEEIYE